MRAIVPIKDIDRRMPEQGRIRIGEKVTTQSGKQAPGKLDVFRFTSGDHQAIAEIADLYGGTPKPFAEQKGQLEVKTTANEIPIVLPPDPLGDTPVYELWSGGGVQRRCDGETALVPQMTKDGAEMQECPCICSAQEKLACKPKTRLTVILPEVRFGGGWRLESGGWNVAHEMPGMVAMIESLQTKGMQRAMLALEQRKSVFAGKTRNFAVPVLRPAVSVDRMLEGGGSVLALSPAPLVPEIFPGELPISAPQEASPQPDPQDNWDEEIVDAEIVEEAPPAGATPTGGASVSEAIASSTSPGLEKLRRKMHASMKEIGLDNTARHALVKRITNGRTESSNDLDEGGLEMLISAVAAMKNAEAFYDGVDEHGMAIVTRR